MENDDKADLEQVNISNHAERQFKDIVQQGLFLVNFGI
jgi:hypothetical protein